MGVVRAVENLFEAGQRLDLTVSEVLLSAYAYHKVQSELHIPDTYLQELMAAGALCAISTIYKKTIDLSSVVDVYYEIIYLHKASENFESFEYKSLLEHIPTTSKIICRLLRFKRLTDLPASYLLAYMKLICASLSVENYYKTHAFVESAWTLMQMCHKNSICVKYKGQHLALAVTFIILMVMDIQIAPSTRLDDWKWIQETVSPDFTDEIYLNICTDMANDVLGK